jgi:hypothetical protein
MNVQVAVLCDAATDDNGKMNLLGAFDTIYAAAVARRASPVRRGAARHVRSPAMRASTSCKLNFMDADGRSHHAELPAEIPVEVDAAGRRRTSSRAISS